MTQSDMEKKIKELEDKLKRIESLSQLQPTSSLENVIRIINRITNNEKRNRQA